MLNRIDVIDVITRLSPDRWFARLRLLRLRRSLQDQRSTPRTAILAFLRYAWRPGFSAQAVRRSSSPAHASLPDFRAPFPPCRLGGWVLIFFSESLSASRSSIVVVVFGGPAYRPYGPLKRHYVRMKFFGIPDQHETTVVFLPPSFSEASASLYACALHRARWPCRGGLPRGCHRESAPFATRYGSFDVARAAAWQCVCRRDPCVESRRLLSGGTAGISPRVNSMSSSRRLRPTYAARRLPLRDRGPPTGTGGSPETSLVASRQSLPKPGPRASSPNVRSAPLGGSMRISATSLA